MVKYIVFLVLLIFCSNSFSQQVSLFKRKDHLIKNPDCCEAAPEYVYEENFEEAVAGETLDGWVNPAFAPSPPDGSMEFAYTVGPLEGTKSLRLLDGAHPHRLAAYSLVSEVHGYFKFKKLAIGDGGPLFNLINGATEDVTTVRTYANGKLGVSQGTGPTYISSDTVDSFSGEVHVWFHYIAGTGANSTMEVFGSTTEIKPASGSSGHAIITTGPALSEVSGVWLYTGYGGVGTDWLFDKIRISRTRIGSYPL